MFVSLTVIKISYSTDLKSQRIPRDLLHPVLVYLRISAKLGNQPLIRKSLQLQNFTHGRVAGHLGTKGHRERNCDCCQFHFFVFVFFFSFLNTKAHTAGLGTLSNKLGKIQSYLVIDHNQAFI